MPKLIVTYDAACYDLAERFLSDTTVNTPANRHELAGNIQRCIEDFIEYECGEPVSDAPSSTSQQGE